MSTICKSKSSTAVTSKMERFVIIVNGWKSLTIITKRSMLDVTAALDPPLNPWWLLLSTMIKYLQKFHCKTVYIFMSGFLWRLGWGLVDIIFRGTAGNIQTVDFRNTFENHHVVAYGRSSCLMLLWKEQNRITLVKTRENNSEKYLCYSTI